jgi:hypothetical protein
LDSPWYNEIIFVKTKAIFLNQKEANFPTLNGSLYWKYPGGVLLKCLLEDEAQQTMKEFYKGDYGGHHY